MGPSSHPASHQERPGAGIRGQDSGRAEGMDQGYTWQHQIVGPGAETHNQGRGGRGPDLPPEGRRSLWAWTKWVRHGGQEEGAMVDV